VDIQKFGLLFRTIKYLKLSQVYFRIRHSIYKKLENPEKCIRSCAPVSTVPVQRYDKKHQIDIKFNKKYLGNNTFTFLNKTIDTKGDWFPEQASQLWIYNLHYFDWIFDISESHTVVVSIANWIDTVKPGTKDAWHPYTISLRICNWIWYVSQNLPSFDKSFIDRIAMSIHGQLQYVQTFIEFDVLGNHLIENCKALIVGGIFLSNAAYYKHGLIVLEKQLEEQILEDGGHYERSPMYHTIVLEDLLNIATAFVCVKNEIPFWIEQKIEKMGLFLHAIVEKNMQFPLLNDAAYGIVTEPKYVLIGCEKVLSKGYTNNTQRTEFFKDSGYFIVRHPELSLTFDCGAYCPNFLPAHAHADMLSYTLAFGDTPIVTDSGTYEYQRGEWRNFFRSTAAHATIQIDEIEQIEFWSSFRVANRGFPKKVQYDKGTNTISAYCTSYQSIGVYIGRSISLRAEAVGITVTDFIQNQGNKNRRWKSYIPLSSELKVREQQTEPGEIYLYSETKSVAKILMPPEAECRVTEGWESKQFGLKKKRPVIILSGVASRGETENCYSIEYIKN